MKSEPSVAGEPSISPNEIHCVEPAKGQRTVLMVDDDQDFRFQQKLRLEEAGYHTVEARSENEALALIEQGCSFDLAVLDLMMDNLDGGFTLAYQIKKERPTTPVIIISSVNAETGLDFGMKSESAREWIKADAFLSKPIRFEQLTREIDRLLGDAH